METKDRYTLRELFNNLEITMTELSKRSGISDVTLGNIRKGQSARLNTINILLRTFSQIYKVKLSLENVDGIIIQGKPVDAIINPVEQATVQPAKDTIKTKSPQNHHSKRSEDVPEDAPVGTVKMIDFSQSSGIPASTLGRWARAGKIEVITVARVSGKGVQHFITPNGQKSAIELDKARKTEEASNPAA
jgi:predicted transcriptional regulator